ncbi:MAG: oxidoreductase [Verrucomicrobia bacterium]|nr:MAG: oxidoreductase [Verrucomicrobiota bacterium]
MQNLPRCEASFTSSKCSASPVTPTRRDFLRTSAAIAGTAVLGQLDLSRSAHAAGSDTIRVGLIGCGGRGGGAAMNALNAGADIRLVALADLFKDKLQDRLITLKEKKGEQVVVKDDHCFTGFDAYQKLLETDVHAVLIAPTSHFMPTHLHAAIEAGKHVFCEKPHGIDMPGVKIAMAAFEEARNKKLAVVSGLCWRYDPGLREGIKRVQDGAIGDVLTVQSTYVSAPYYPREHKPEWSEMEFQFRNWYHFNWLSGDQTAQQLIHSVDKASWVLGDRPPERVWGMGGRQTCLAPKFGDQFDHQAVIFEYTGGQRLYGFTRDQENCYFDVSDYVIGTKGKFKFNAYKYALSIEGEKNWTYQIPNPKLDMYDAEHKELFDSIRAGHPINNGNYACLSTKLAVAAQMAVYSGQALTWEKVEQSKRSFALEKYGFDVTPPIKPGEDGRYPTAMQGKAEIDKWMMEA